VTILLQKAKIASCYFFRENRIGPITVDLCSLNRLSEVTHEFVVKR
jgi:hypothetical protein